MKTTEGLDRHNMLILVCMILSCCSPGSLNMIPRSIFLLHVKKEKKRYLDILVPEQQLNVLMWCALVLGRKCGGQLSPLEAPHYVSWRGFSVHLYPRGNIMDVLKEAKKKDVLPRNPAYSTWLNVSNGGSLSSHSRVWRTPWKTWRTWVLFKSRWSRPVTSPRLTWAVMTRQLDSRSFTHLPTIKWCFSIA